MSDELHEANLVTPGSLIPAAVLIPLLFPEKTESGASYQLRTSTGCIRLPLETEVVLTVRSHELEHHKGQIAFPGGVYEAQDISLEETALRESHEEIGLARELVQIVGELPDIPTVATRFNIRPYIGLVHGHPPLLANPSEISEILFIPLRHLLDPAHSVLESHERGGVRYRIRAYHFNTHRIWGATGLMIQTLIEKFVSEI